MEKVLFVIRAQPLHKGHIHAIKKLLEKYKVIIALGSINKKNKRNPFSFSKRRQMIKSTIGSSIKIIGIEDKKSDVKWRKSIEKKVKFDLIVTGNQWTRKCFNRYRAKKPAFFKPRIYNSSRIRKLINEGKKWEHLVPKSVVKIIKPGRI